MRVWSQDQTQAVTSGSSPPNVGSDVQSPSEGSRARMRENSSFRLAGASTSSQISDGSSHAISAASSGVRPSRAPSVGSEYLFSLRPSARADSIASYPVSFVIVVSSAAGVVVAALCDLTVPTDRTTVKHWLRFFSSVLQTPGFTQEFSALGGLGAACRGRE